MKKYITGIAIVCCLAGTSVLAQDNSIANNKWKMELGYNVGIPIGDFKTNEINNTSFRGVTGGINYQLNSKFSLGLNVGYQNYYQKFDRQLFKGQDNQTISAVKTNSIEMMPVILKGTYFPMAGNTKAKLQPYLSAGAGLNVVNYQQYYGEFGGAEYSAPLALQAGAGLQMPLSSNGKTSLKLGATYNYSGYTKNDYTTKLGNVGIHAGLVFPFK